MEEEYYIVDFESVTIDRETYDKLEDEMAIEFYHQWILEHARIDQIVRGDEK